jgi:hypothetical protein
MQEELLKWNEYVGNGELLGLSGEELRIYQVNNREFDATIK